MHLNNLDEQVDNTLKEMLNDITSVQLELSNLCNLAMLHKKCYAHESEHKNGKIILSGAIVRETLELLKTYGWDGLNKEIKFHEYNEPTNDPRLLKFVEEARQCCPQTNILLWTNGWYLNDTIMREMIESGINRFRITAYSDSENERFEHLREQMNTALLTQNLKPANNLPVYVRINRRTQLDDRLQILENSEGQEFPSCYALKGLSIRANGFITMCCMDVYQTVTMGNVKEGVIETLLENMAKREIIRKGLQEGLRTEGVCKKCNHARPNAEYSAQQWEAYKIG